MNKYNDSKLVILNKSNKDLKIGDVVSVDKTASYVSFFWKYRNFKWYHKLLGLKPIFCGLVKNVNLEGFKDGDTLYVDSNHAGSLTNVKPNKD